MDRQLYTAAAHAQLELANPISGETIDRAMGVLVLPAGAQVIDVGCGKGTVALRIARRWRGRVDAIDTSERMIDEVRRRSDGAPVNPVLADAGAFVRHAETGSYDGAVCIGASHALGGTAAMFAQLARIVRPGGSVLVGEGVWEQPPATGYMNATGLEAGEFGSLGELVAAAEVAGVRPSWVTTASQAEWDEYEWAHARGIEAFAAANPDHPDVPAMLERSRTWRAAYLRWGRGTLGFALLVCRRE